MGAICREKPLKLKESAMKNLQNSVSLRFILAVAGGLAASTASSHAQTATATISGVAAGGGEYDYTITLSNPGSDAYSLNSFWYAWTTSGTANNLTTTPTSPANSLGWGNSVDAGTYSSIMWQNSSGTALAPGQSGTFTFDSTETPATITTSPSGESVVYVGTIDFSEGSAGDSSGAFSPALVVPEPSSVGLLLAGFFVLAGSYKWRSVSRKSLQIAPAVR
jgi:hypothetical protein